MPSIGYFFASAFRFRPAALLLAVGLATTGCAGTPDALRDATPVDAGAPADLGDQTRPDVYLLRPGDTLRVTVFGHEELSKDYVIDSGGFLTLPLLDRVEAAGLTAPELRDIIRAELDARYLVDPRVSVEIETYRPIIVSGEVNDDGRFDYEPGMTVRDAVAIAGGYTRRARRDVFAVRRRGADGQVQVFEASEDTPVLPGDGIEVFRRVF